MKKVLMLVLVVASLTSLAGCAYLGIADNAENKAAFVTESKAYLAEEGITATDAELEAIWEAGSIIAQSDAANTIVMVIAGNKDASAKIQELLKKYSTK